MSDLSNAARSRIMARLKAAPTSVPPELPAWSPPAYLPDERLARFTALMEALHSEVYEVTAADWPERLRTILSNRGINRVMYAPATQAGRQLADTWTNDAPTLVAYDRPVEELKDTLVSGVDAAVTTTLGGIAETGTLVLWPTPDEPRLMSLLPPIHVALVEADSVVDNLAGLIAQAGWAKAMPTNAVLISGPSKTADIEQTLAYGVHGPKELIVLVIKRV
ncbi:MAG: lactate utilization protein [Rhodospirillaceae bacterium]|nr:lactate utilization protein [Rhodospirillales bacterium]